MRNMLLTALTAAGLLSLATFGSQAQAVTVAVPSAVTQPWFRGQPSSAAIAAASEPIIATMGIDRTATAIVAGTNNLVFQNSKAVGPV